MLAVTDDAAEAIKTMLSAQGQEAESGGLRLAASAEDPQGALEVSLATGPAADDSVVEHAGARVFVEEQIAQHLDSVLLDIQPDDEGQLQLSLRPQTEG